MSPSDRPQDPRPASRLRVTVTVGLLAAAYYLVPDHRAVVGHGAGSFAGRYRDEGPWSLVMELQTLCPKTGEGRGSTVAMNSAARYGDHLSRRARLVPPLA